MSEHRIQIDGELYLTIERVAEIYAVQSVWLVEAYRAGLLGQGHERGATLCIAAVQLDRVATVVRLRHLLGPDLERIELALPRDD
jgi:hypothetical protein